MDLEIRGILLGIWSGFFGNGNTVGFGFGYLDLRLGELEIRNIGWVLLGVWGIWDFGEFGVLVRGALVRRLGVYFAVGV